MKGKDIALIPEADGAQFIKPTDGARQAFKGWAKGKDDDLAAQWDKLGKRRGTLISRIMRDPTMGRGLNASPSILKDVKEAEELKAKMNALAKQMPAKERRQRGVRDSVRTTDGILSSPFMALAALLAILSHFNSDRVSPSDYNLMTYKPKRKIF